MIERDIVFINDIHEVLNISIMVFLLVTTYCYIVQIGNSSWQFMLINKLVYYPLKSGNAIRDAKWNTSKLE